MSGTPSTTLHRWILTCPSGAEPALASELRALGIEPDVIQTSTVTVQASLRDGYRMWLWCRVPSRLLLSLATYQGDDPNALYEAVKQVPWWEHFSVEDSFAIGHSATASLQTASTFGVQRAKDGIVDRFRDHGQGRPSVDKREADIRFHLHMNSEGGEFSLDLSSDGLHRRGYRDEGGRAPLKENLAAGIVHLARWPEVAESQYFIDPMCGSGTLALEAAAIAANLAPRLFRGHAGWEKWLNHDARMLDEEREAARSATRSAQGEPRVLGFDASRGVVDEATQAAERIGLRDWVRFEVKSMQRITRIADAGVLVVNPPYGHRLGDESTVFLLYQQLGDMFKSHFGGWTAYVFAAHQRSLKHIGLRPTKRHVLYNGAIECRLLEIPVEQRIDSSTGAHAPGWRKPSDESEMLLNRLKKSRRNLHGWSKQHHVTAYRAYDGDIPEYRDAIDVYNDYAVVHVDGNRRGIDPELLEQRLIDVVTVVPQALHIPSDHVVVKVRQRHDEGEQYTRFAQVEERLEVTEGDVRYLVNLYDRIDTGLYLDHRIVREHARNLGEGVRVLNLFSYTCAVSVAAAVGGATTTNVDLSNTYLDWGKDNFRQNSLDPEAHQFIRDDVTRWASRLQGEFDWIFVNPPTFSRSKMSKGEFQVSRDHAPVLEACMKALAPEGELLFTTHARDFDVDSKLKREYYVEECSEQWTPADFRRSPFSAFRMCHRVLRQPRHTKQSKRMQRR